LNWLTPTMIAVLLLAPALAIGQGADGEFNRRSSEHFVLLQDVDIDQRVGREGWAQFERDVLDVLEDAHDHVDDLLGIRPRGMVQVLVYDPDIFDDEFAGILPFSAVGFYHGVIRVRGGVRVDSKLRRLLNHEYVHAAFDAAAPRVRIPAWVNEGTAEWVAHNALGHSRFDPRLRSQLQSVERSGKLLAIRQMSGLNFAGLQKDQVGIAYAESHALIDYLVRYRGEITFRRFLAQILRSGDAKHALRSSYSLKLDELEEDFVTDLRGR